MEYAAPDFQNKRDDSDPSLIGFLRVEGSAMCEVSYKDIDCLLKFFLYAKLYDGSSTF